MIQRSGDVVIHMLENVKQATIKPIIEKVIKPKTLIYTDEYAIYDRLIEWGYDRKSVCHGAGEYARDEDGDGFCEIHVNTMEGFWSLLRSWLRPHRGISQEKLPLYLGFFEFIHNMTILRTLLKVHNQVNTWYMINRISVFCKFSKILTCKKLKKLAFISFSS
jgi:transposase-like protein